MGRSNFIFEAGFDGLFDLHNRRRVMKLIVVITLLTFLPLSLKNFIIGETLLAILLLLFEFSLLIEVHSVLYLRKQIFGYSIPLALLGVSITLAVHIFGTLATYWAFPVITTIVFIVPRFSAIAINSLIIVGTTIAAYQHQDPMVTLRLTLALIFCAVISHFVIEAVRKLQQDLRYLSTRDSLTGALNRHQLDAFLEDASYDNPEGQVASVAIIDIDHFKQVNDVFGHDVGDQVIKIVVELINTHSRQRDLLFRLGGDEFLLLFNNTNQDSAYLVLTEICNQVRERHYPKLATVTLSVGIAESKPNEDVDQWVKRADIALYEAKRSGRDAIFLDSDQSKNIPKYTLKDTSEV
ncbi:GGDEF domain-containing protein [Vibrio sp. T187]|uniref:GGDEF domain-containing protein n=1 Tax=Vibrio TaxID=662 RepID=UPI0010C9C622|nr:MULTISPECIES: GGDEF domain-containing protein [Vibrio]MBW3698291.1 GGDEF domain-containing protein [Vibrio sp. T187]